LYVLGGNKRQKLLYIRKKAATLRIFVVFRIVMVVLRCGEKREGVREKVPVQT
jgi:hypothetical protein